ncbi:MAG: hypothetical protein ABIH82_05300 [Candidatus Woesearchaeota archaeon]
MNKKKSNDVKSKLFLISITMVLLVLIIISFNVRSNTSGNAIQLINYAQEGSEVLFEVKDLPCLKEANVLFENSVKDGKISFDDGGRKPFNGDVICWFTISSEEKVKSLDLTLKVKESELNGLDKSDLALFIDNKKLFTSLMEEKNGYFYYKAKTDKLGEFIFGKRIEEVGQFVVKDIESVDEVSVEAKEVVNDYSEMDETFTLQEDPLLEDKKQENKGGSMLTGNVVADIPNSAGPSFFEVVFSWFR